MDAPSVLIKKALRMVFQYPVSLYGGYRDRDEFADIDAFFIFVGYPRSGHTLIGSMLDAHPNIVCGQELAVLNYVLAGFSQKQIFYLLCQSARNFTRRGRKWNEYRYLIPDQWQGRAKRVRIIGDKKGGGSSIRLKSHPKALAKLQQVVQVRTCFIHEIRNPFDNIATLSIKGGRSLDRAIDFYFSLCRTVLWVKTRVDAERFFEMRHEDFVADPKKWLGDLCRFLGAEAPEDYLNACSDIVFPSPKQTRTKLNWSARQIQKVETEMADIPFLQGYTYEA